VDGIEAYADTRQWLVGSGQFPVLFAEEMVERLASPPKQSLDGASL
jgi:hypothetical protein